MLEGAGADDEETGLLVEDETGLLEETGAVDEETGATVELGELEEDARELEAALDEDVALVGAALELGASEELEELVPGALALGSVA